MELSSYVALYNLSEIAMGLLVKKPNTEETYLFLIHKTTGTLDFSGILGHSVFLTRKKAEEYVYNLYNCSIPVLVGISLIGVNRFGKKLCIAIITEAKPIAYFLNRHCVYKISNVEYYWMEIPYYPEIEPREARRINRLSDFPVIDFHMFCETRDITSPLGRNTHKPDFVWNNFFSAVFTGYGVRDACCYLLEGTASTKVIRFNDYPFRFSILTLRSSAHAGTRYYSRGLDEKGYPGNEVQCELIIEGPDGCVTSHCWRRGTVPVVWRTNQGTALPTATLEVEEDYARYTPKYFERLNKEFGCDIFLMNLLHNNEGHDEKPLCNAYKDAISGFRNIKYCEFDWHAKKKELGVSKAVEEFWERALEGIGTLSYTLMRPTSHVLIDDFVSDEFMFQNDCELRYVEYNVEKIQKSIIRVNCMDSLDRTNVGCFYYTCLFLLNNLLNIVSQPSYDMIMELGEELRKFLALAFISIGDTVSLLYTNTPACMTNIFRETGGIVDKAASDSSIAMQRRYQNFVVDKKRQKAINIFIGQSLDKLLPNLSIGINLTCASSYPGSYLPPFPDFSMKGDLLQSSLGYSPTNIKIENIPIKTHVLIMLNSHVYIESLIINLVPDHPPFSVQIEAGLLLTSLCPLCSAFSLPCSNSSNQLILRIPPEYSNGNFPYARVVRLSFSTPEKAMSLSNIFIFGYKKNKSMSFSTYPSTYNDFSMYKNDQMWPKIYDTSPLKSVITKNKEVSFDSAINIELARLHHKNSRLETAAMLLSNGLNPSDLGFSSFKIKSDAFQLPIPEFSRHNCDSDPSTVFRCFHCSNEYCTKCNEKTTLETSFFFNDPITLCKDCYAIWIMKENKVINLHRFYSSFYRLHFPFHFEIEKWFDTQTNSILANNELSFPRISFIAMPKSDSNMVIQHNGGNLDSNSSYQIGFGAPYMITEMTIECLDRAELTIQCISQDTIPSIDSTLQLDVNVMKVVPVKLQAQILTIYISLGSVRRIIFKGEPLIPAYRPSFSQISSKFPSTISKRNSLSQTDSLSVFKLSKTSLISGIVCDKLTGVHSMVVLFYETVDSDKPNEYESFYIPVGNPDYILPFPTKHSAQLVKVFLYDKSQDYTGGKMALY